MLSRCKYVCMYDTYIYTHITYTHVLQTYPPSQTCTMRKETNTPECKAVVSDCAIKVVG